MLVNEYRIGMVAFAPDGRSVLVSGLVGSGLEESEGRQVSGLLDVYFVSGTVRETGINGLAFVPTQAAADDLYLWTRFEDVPKEGCEVSSYDIQEPLGLMLWRLDEAALEPIAVRDFDSSVNVVVVPLSGEAWQSAR